MFKFLYVSMMVLLSNSVMAIDVELPNAEGSDGLFSGFRGVMQSFVNFLLNDFAFFAAVILLFAGIVVYKLAPTSAFVKTLFEYGGVVIMLFFVFRFVNYIFELF